MTSVHELPQHSQQCGAESAHGSSHTSLQENEAWSALLAEISLEAGQVAQFLIDREIEAPERYSAVQSYRVAMAVLRQQRLFAEV